MPEPRRWSAMTMHESHSRCPICGRPMSAQPSGKDCPVALGTFAALKPASDEPRIEDRRYPNAESAHAHGGPWPNPGRLASDEKGGEP